MAGGGGAQSSRGRGKFRKFTRGGGKHFSKNLRPLDADGNEVGMWGDAPEKKDSDDSEEEESEEEEDSEEESGDDAAGSSAAAAAAAELSREERKKEKQARKAAAIKAKKGPVQVGDMPPSDSEEEESDAAPVNPNHSRAARNQTKKPSAVDDVADDVKEMSVGPNKRERDAIAAQEAKERYRKLHEAGKTDEAKADLARLREIRKKREEEAARKLAEKQEKDEQDRIKRAEIEAREAKRREAALGIQKKKKK